MGRKKTTGETTIGYSFRLNPAYPQDKDAIDLMNQWLAEGYSVRQIMTDAILARGGRRPQMYSNREDNTAQLLSSFENMLTRFGEEMLQELQQRVATMPAIERVDDGGNGDDSEWVQNFTKGFMARQAQVMGDDD
jgi:hypothetical protein